MTLPCMIFAAGKGTRMRPLTDHMPKPLLRVAGRPLIDIALAIAREARATRIVVNLHHLGELLDDHLSRESDVTTIWERDTLLETGGGLRAALPLLGSGPVMVLNADAVWTGANPLDELLAGWDDARMDALLLTLPAPEATGFALAGDFLIGSDGRLARANGAPGVAYLGAQILKTEDLADVVDPVFSLNLIWDRMIARNRLCGMTHRGGWCDVGRPDGLDLAEQVLAKGAEDG